MTSSQELLKIIENKTKLLRMVKGKQKWPLSICKLVILKDCLKIERRLFEQQIEELHSCKMKIKKKYGGGRRRSGDV